ncbi:MAG TPA: 3-hydroxyacyl-ACP dehydratase FabZ [Oligoflexia bacterium]|nr:3-hydroxyacyl-ACP dehydratase FabZ [Oligoflexia bacterium]HMP47074.1 3-hydroxyacyl-ACP dehydratase FabZ [Oligoflexia bacterium]
MKVVDEIKFPLKNKDILELLPHRYPMLLVDRVFGLSGDDTIIGIKNVSANEAFFEGHFPANPIMPGVLILEALAQLGVIYAKICEEAVDRQGLYVFAGADSVRFRRPVVPGDVLQLEMKLLTRKKRIWKMEGKASVEGEMAAEGVLTAALFESSSSQD